jgi:hypothetical protein
MRSRLSSIAPARDSCWSAAIVCVSVIAFSSLRYRGHSEPWGGAESLSYVVPNGETAFGTSTREHFAVQPGWSDEIARFHCGFA